MTTRWRDFHGTMIPTATRMRVFSCGLPDCKHAHLVCFDEEDQPFCEVVLNEYILLEAQGIIEDADSDDKKAPECSNVIPLK